MARVGPYFEPRTLRAETRRGFTLLDDIATVLNDVAVMTKIATKKTAGVLAGTVVLGAVKLIGKLRPKPAAAQQSTRPADHYVCRVSDIRESLAIFEL